MTVFVKNVWVEDPSTHKSTQPLTVAQMNRIENGIEEALQGVANALYKAIEISNASIEPPQVAIGREIQGFTINCLCNKEPSQISLKQGNTDVPHSANVNGSSVTLTTSGLAISSSTTYTVTAMDERGATASRNLTIDFLNFICYGAASTPQEITSTFVNSLASKDLSKTRAKTITVNAGSGQFIWIAIPSRLGSPSFSVGGFEGGFTLAATLQVTNSASYAEEYKVYKSDNAGLGSTRVVIG